jgi:hypothetical protein
MAFFGGIIERHSPVAQVTPKIDASGAQKPTTMPKRTSPALDETGHHD